MKSLYHNAPVFSQLFLVAAGMCFILNIFGHNTAFTLMSLSPGQITQNYELWRLLTYPLSTLSTESFLLLTVSMGLFSSILEVTFSTRRFVLSIVCLVVAQGLLYTLAFASGSKSVVLSGGDSISFFVMAMFTFVMPSRNLSIWRGLEIRGLYLVLTLALVSFCVSALKAARDGSEVFYYGAISSAFGVAFAVLLTTVLHQRLRRVRRLGTVSMRDNNDSLVEQEEELVSSYGKPERVPSKTYFPTIHVSDEELMNQLLDKIFEHGQESLTPEEKSFLEDYSQRIR